MLRRNACGAWLLALAVAGCTSDMGMGIDLGNPGQDGGDAPSVSGVSPSLAYLGRTVDLTISGSGTHWTSAAKVVFSDANIAVNSVTVASPTGIVANVTIGADSAVAATDVTVSDGSEQVAYKGGFQVKAPLEVSVDGAGVPQGGFAIVHAHLLDSSTPFDIGHVTVSSSRKDLAFEKPTATAFDADFRVRADVSAVVGDVDLQLSSGVQTPIRSPAKKAFAVAARTPAAIAGGQASGMIDTVVDTDLYLLSPVGTTDRFLQILLSSMTGPPLISVLPPSGKFADAVATFTGSYGRRIATADPFYLVVLDGSITAPGALKPPYDYQLAYAETAVTVSAEPAESAATNDDSSATAIAIPTLPGLVTATLGYGSVQPAADDDYFKVTVTGASVASPKSLHVATGGDGLTDTVLEVFGTDGTTSLNTSHDVDAQENLVVSIDTDGTYFVRVGASGEATFTPSHNTYELFVEVK